jgi:hypothetical protein
LFAGRFRRSKPKFFGHAAFVLENLRAARRTGPEFAIAAEPARRETDPPTISKRPPQP